MFGTFQGSGPGASAIPALALSAGSPYNGIIGPTGTAQSSLILEGAPRPASVQWKISRVQLMAGTRFRPGPTTGFYINPEGRSHLTGLQDRSRVHLAFLGFALPGNSRSHLGIGAIESVSGPGLLYYSRNASLFFHPGSSRGFASIHRRWSGPGLQQQLYGNLYRDDSGTGGYGSYRLAGRGTFPWKAILKVGRFPSRDLNPQSKKPFPDRKGRSGFGFVEFFQTWMELSAAGEDRGMNQYRFIQYRLLGPNLKGIRPLIQGETLRTFRYKSDRAFHYYRSAGIGIRIGQRPLDLEEDFSLDPRFWMQIVASASQERARAEIDFSYKKGDFYFQAGYHISQWPVSARHHDAIRRPAVRFHRGLKQQFRFEMGSRNVYASYIYSERLSPGEETLDSHFLRLEASWCLQECSSAGPQTQNDALPESDLNPEFLDQMQNKSHQARYNVDYHNGKKSGRREISSVANSQKNQNTNQK